MLFPIKSIINQYAWDLGHINYFYFDIFDANL